MAKEKSGKEVSVEDKLRALYDLQLIDSKIDRIRTVRGELPLEVQDLEDEIEGLKTRVDNFRSEMDRLEKEVAERKSSIKDSEALIKRYTEQQGNVKNNREYDSLSKEIEYQTLEMQLCEKKIKESKASMEHKKDIVKEAESIFSNRKKDLDAKKGELKEIIEETEKEEAFLLKKSEEASGIVDDRLLKAYKRIRSSSKNGLAVVPIDRGASGGSFIKIPPQRQLDIASRKRIIVDEHSGRILIDQELAEEQTERMNKQLGKSVHSS